MAFARFVVSVVTSVMALSGAGLAYGQEFPTRPVRIVAGDPGGAGDFAARLIAQGTSVSLGQQVIVDNRGNSTGVVVSKALPDGYTVLVDSGGFWISPFIQKMSYDVLKDFVPVGMLTLSPNVLVVHPSSPANSVKELVALAKAKPGALNFASAGVGSTPHLAAELFKSMTGVNIVHVPYKGAGPAVIDLIGGQVQMMIGSAPSVMPNVRAGKLRALAVGTLQPTALVPGVATMTSAGLTGYEAGTLMGMFAPTKTPSAIINRINQDVVRTLNQPEVKEKLFNAGSDVIASTPAEFDTKLKSELAKWGKLIKDIGISAN
jgi:tripartite-type tricarboxylate transporter receptor subunit TctC